MGTCRGARKLSSFSALKSSSSVSMAAGLPTSATAVAVSRRCWMSASVVAMTSLALGRISSEPMAARPSIVTLMRLIWFIFHISICLSLRPAGTFRGMACLVMRGTALLGSRKSPMVWTSMGLSAHSQSRMLLAWV